MHINLLLICRNLPASLPALRHDFFGFCHFLGELFVWIITFSYLCSENLLILKQLWSIIRKRRIRKEMQR